MNKTIKRNVVVSALLAIMLCISLIAGATFALFTSESSVNIAVTSGKVDVKASIENFEASHPVSISTETNEPSERYLRGFYGGSADYNADTNAITLENMVAGDKVTFDLVITNYSTVAVKFKTTYTATGDKALINALDISVGNSTGWVSLAAAAEGGSVVNTLNCYVEMPCNANVQDMSCTLSFLVEAVQGNADVVEDENIVYISNADELVAFANSFVENVNCQYKGKTVYLTNDIDLTGRTDFNGIGFRYMQAPEGDFHGTFDGQNHTISNFTISNTEWNYSSAGLFNGVGTYGVVKNVKVENAVINSTHYAGGIAGTSYGKIENCEVVNSNITSTSTLINGNYDNGDKAGGIVGYMYEDTITNKCSVANTTITAYRDLAAIAGYANVRSKVTNCTIGENVVVKVDRTHNYQNYTQASEYDAGNFVGQAVLPVGDVTTGNTGNATILNFGTIYYISNEAELFAFADNFKDYGITGDVAVLLTADITLTQNWTPMTRAYNAIPNLLQLTFDGGNHTISNVANTGDLRQGGFFGEYSQTGSSLTIKNLKLNNVSFNGDFVDDNAHEDSGCGAVIAWVGNNATVMVENVEVSGVDISGFKYSGGIVGYVSVNIDFTIDNCAVIGTETKKTVNSKNHVGGIIGYVQMAGSNGQTIIVKNSKVKNIVVSSTDSDKGREGAVVGSLRAGCYVKDVTVEDVTVQGVAATTTKVIGALKEGVVENVTIR